MPEKSTTFSPSRERSERENQQFRFYVWFQNQKYARPDRFYASPIFERSEKEGVNCNALIVNLHQV
ncbi:MAG: hypothetical protein U5L45_08165 [Saprospiraceae bacterium]|nr:hypothetical protein [Saprospiraceae bacterium]